MTTSSIFCTYLPTYCALRKIVNLLSLLPPSPFLPLQVLRMLGDNHIHRVYLLDPEAPLGSQLQGVVTPTDILCWLAGLPTPKLAAVPRKTFSGVLPATALPAAVKC